MLPESLRNIIESCRHVDEFNDALSHLQRHLGKLESLDVLEAGSGAKSNLTLNNCAVTGIDISPHQLNRNRSLQDMVCADLHTYENEAWTHRFDLIICWDVLEHLRSPRTVIEKFSDWIKTDGGRLVIVFPNSQSLKGNVTKYSPHYFHRLFYKITSGTPMRAARDDRGAFKTFFARDIDLCEVIGSMELNSFKVTLLLSFESYQNKWIKRYVPAALINKLNKIFLGPLKNSLDTAATDFILVASSTDSLHPQVEHGWAKVHQLAGSR
jgi:SAM-dependent methyltransferase